MNNFCKTVITAAGFLPFRNGVSFEEKKKKGESHENDHLKSERDNDTSDNG